MTGFHIFLIIFFSIIFLLIILMIFIHYVHKNIIKYFFKIIQNKYNLSSKKLTLIGKINNIPINIHCFTLPGKLTIKINSNTIAKNIQKKIYTTTQTLYKKYIPIIWSPELHNQIKDLKKYIGPKNMRLSIKNDKIILKYDSQSVLDGKLFNKSHKDSNCNILISHISQLTILANDIIKKPRIKNRIINNIKNYPDDSVRLANLNILLDLYSINDEINLILENLLNDNNLTIKIIAALHIKNTQKAPGFLMSLLEKEDKIDKDNLANIIEFFYKKNYTRSYENLKKLLKKTRFKKAKSKIINFLLSENKKENDIFLLNFLKINKYLYNEQKIKIINQLQMKKYKSFIPILIKLYVKTKNKILKKAILNSFIVLKDKSVIPFLLQQLNKPGISYIYILDTIAECGDKDAIEPLYILNQKINNSTYKAALQNTIAKIQSRMGSVEKGWVSISETDTKKGGISEAKDISEGSISKIKLDK